MARGRGRGRGKRRKSANQGKFWTKSSTSIGQVFISKESEIKSYLSRYMPESTLLTNYKMAKFYNSFSICFQSIYPAIYTITL